MPAPRKAKTTAQVVAGGDYRASLEAIRDRLAAEMATAEGASLASVAKQLADVLSRLENLPSKEASALDDLAKRRTRRRKTIVGDEPAGDVERGTRGGRSGRSGGT